MYLFNQHPRFRGWQLPVAMVNAVIKNQKHPLAAAIIRAANQIINH